VLIQSQARRRSCEHAGECCLAHDERIAAQIIAVEFDQVEGVHEHVRVMLPVSDAKLIRRRAHVPLTIVEPADGTQAHSLDA
jgi:hypothetical protein